MTPHQHPLCNPNVPAPNTPYFTPLQSPPAGTALCLYTKKGQEKIDHGKCPKLFLPLRIRDVVFQNRIWVSPMCQYSAENGFATPWHMAHLGGILQRGPGHTMIEATAVTPNGRITPQDLGIWSDAHISSLASLVTFAHSQNAKIGIQLAHAGRKASTIAPWIEGLPLATRTGASVSREQKEEGAGRWEKGWEKAGDGWPDDVWAPSSVKYLEDYALPHELSVAAIKGLVKEFGKGAERSIKAGFDTIEIHGAHGYLIDEFLSPVSNKRGDEYGGSWENRVRFLLEIVDEVRKVMPDGMPLFVRVSGTDWLEESMPNEASWRSEDTCRLAPVLYERGVDLLDVSSGGNHPKQQIKGGAGYQAWLAKNVMRTIGTQSAYMDGGVAGLGGILKNTADCSGSGGNPQGKSDSDTARAWSGSGSAGRPSRLIVSTVGAITTGTLAERLLEEGSADVIMVGRHFLRNPYTVWAWAEELDVEIKLPGQFAWGFKGRGKKTSDGKEDHVKGSEQKRCKV